MAALPPKPTTRKPKPSILGNQGYASQSAQQQAQANVPFQEVAGALSGQKLPPRGGSGPGPGPVPPADPRFPPRAVGGPQAIVPKPLPRITPPGVPNLPKGYVDSGHGRGNLDLRRNPIPTDDGGLISMMMQGQNQGDQPQPDAPPPTPEPVTPGGPPAGAQPQVPIPPRGPQYQGGGVNNDKWNNPNHNTPKYEALRIADEVPPSELRAQIRSRTGPQYEKLKALGYSFSSDDKISRPDISGGKWIDIIHGDNTEYGWNTNTGAKPVPLPKPGVFDSGHGNDKLPHAQGGGQQIKPAGPMVAPNGAIPPGLPYNPDLARQGFTAATPQPLAVDNTFQARENELINQLLNNPMYDQQFQNQLNEQQKELALARGNAGQEQLLQNAASRGVSNGGALQANQLQLNDDTTRQLLQSQRDVSMGVQEANRNSLMDALDMSTTTSYNRNNSNSQFFDNMMQGRNFDLDRDLSIEGLKQKQTVSNQWERDFANSRDEFTRNLKWQYDNANLNSQQRLIEWILRGGKI